MSEFKKLHIASFDISKSLKDLGFDERCIWYYILTTDGKHNNIPVRSGNNSHFLENWNSIKTRVSAPMNFQIVDWLKEKHNIDLWVKPFTYEKPNGEINVADKTFSYFLLKDGLFIKDEIEFNSPNEAQNKAIKESIKLI